MELTITKEYLTILFLLWIAPVVSSIWGGPVWITVSFMALFAIYAGHEWMHVWICKENDLQVESVTLATGGKTKTVFSIEEDQPGRILIESKVYLAGVAWDSVWFTLSAVSSIFYALLQNELIPLVFGLSLILILIFNLAVPGSDWQEFRKRTAKEV